MLQNAYEAARRIVADHDTLLLSQQAFDAFIASLRTPPSRTEALKSCWRGAEWRVSNCWPRHTSATV